MIVPTSYASVAEVARRQLTGGYSTQSDALSALMLVERLARMLNGEDLAVPSTPYDDATAFLTGRRWTRAEADALILLINQGAATLPA